MPWKRLLPCWQITSTGWKSWWTHALKTDNTPALKVEAGVSGGAGSARASVERMSFSSAFFPMSPGENSCSINILSIAHRMRIGRRDNPLRAHRFQQKATVVEVSYGGFLHV
jgi:hypothetical protein